ncbi:MAG: sigma factor-like helix-turn-helix DNA-binding protein [Gemmatimonadales bacterium]
MERAIGDLPPRTRDTLVLRIRRQLRNTEIADVLGISLKTVEGNLARAKHLLRLVLGPRL